MIREIIHAFVLVQVGLVIELGAVAAFAVAYITAGNGVLSRVKSSRAGLQPVPVRKGPGKHMGLGIGSSAQFRLVVRTGIFRKPSSYDIAAVVIDCTEIIGFVQQRAQGRGIIGLP